MTLGVWQATGAQDIIGKVFGVFFPVLAFVAIGRYTLLPELTGTQPKLCMKRTMRWGRSHVPAPGRLRGTRGLEP